LRKTKRTGHEWILGLAAESISAQSARKKSIFFPVEQSRKMFINGGPCSERCKAKYMNRLFREEAVA
jgi:hypothetical protein